MAVLAIRRIARSDSKTRATFEQAAVGMTQIDLNGYVIDANGALCEILERARSELVGERFDGFRHPDGEDTMERCRHDLIEGDAQRCVLEQRYLRPDGKAVQCKVTASLVHDGNQRPSYFIAVVEDVSEAHRLAAELAHQAAHDSLTGLLNRASFEQRLDEAVRSAHERQRRHVLGFIDLDQFKVVNDTCGHIAGDELLQQASALMRAELAQSDVLARLGGDEFGVIFRGEEMDAAAAAAERLRAAVAEYVFVWGERSFNITISMGLVAVNEHSPDTGGLLQAADTACYLAKDRGRNRIQRYAESAEEIALRRGEMEWIGRLREAMKEDRLRLDAQPIQPLGDHGGLRCELLVRLIDTEGEVHYPGAFLGAAERYNAASALDRWVLATTCRHLAEDQDLLTRFESIHVNLSAQSLDGTAFLEFVEETLDRYGTPGEALCFEITETAAISNLPEARRFIERLAARGCSFALDDFGSGLSSFGYLKALPIDIIKIDGAFVRHIDSDPADMAVVRSIHEIARAVGIRTVAEFVETAEAQRILTEIGVDFGQGFHIARPAALSETLALAAGS
jgi:diguanylate cyclase (GGDEF)-like protein/PAS domain S-box-containing protein